MPQSVNEEKIDLSLKASRKHRTGIECRREQRLATTGAAKIILLATRVSLEVKLRDLSRRGIGIVHNAPLQRGERFLLILPASTVTSKRALVCTVVFCRVNPNGEHEIGAAFTNILANGILPLATPEGSIVDIFARKHRTPKRLILDNSAV